MIEHSKILGLLKKGKEIALYLTAFFIFFYYFNPALMQQLFAQYMTTAGASASMLLIAVFVNWVKTQHPNSMPRFLEK